MEYNVGVAGLFFTGVKSAASGDRILPRRQVVTTFFCIV